MRLFLFLCSLFIFHSSFAFAQEAAWSASVSEVGGGEYEVVFEARVPPGWHLYDLGPYKIAGLATGFDFSLSNGVELVGTPYEIGEPVHRMDETFGFETGWYEGTARFGQKVKASENAVVAGEVEYQICQDAVGCIRGVWEFSVPIDSNSSAPAPPLGADDDFAFAKSAGFPLLSLAPEGKDFGQ